MLYQHKNLSDIAAMIKEHLVSAEAFKIYVDQVRCASYPDVDKFNEERATIEKSWPAYADDQMMCQVPHFISTLALHTIPHLLQQDYLDRWLHEGVL